MPPIHDQYCRCRDCKPPLGPAPADTAHSAWCAALIVFGVVAICLGLYAG